MGNPYRAKFGKENGKIEVDIHFNEEEYKYLVQYKGNLTWREFILLLSGYYEDKRKTKLQITTQVM